MEIVISFHPVRDYLNSLLAWDGKKRIDGILIKYLSADDTDYVRTVTRKTFVAAVARIYSPGTKFDSVLVLDSIAELILEKDKIDPSKTKIVCRTEMKEAV